MCGVRACASVSVWSVLKYTHHFADERDLLH